MNNRSGVTLVSLNLLTRASHTTTSQRIQFLSLALSRYDVPSMCDGLVAASHLFWVQQVSTVDGSLLPLPKWAPAIGYDAVSRPRSWNQKEHRILVHPLRYEVVPWRGVLMLPQLWFVCWGGFEASDEASLCIPVEHLGTACWAELLCYWVVCA